MNSSHTTESVSKHEPLQQSEKLIVSKTGETERVRKCHREGCQAYEGERRGRRCREKVETRTLEETKARRKLCFSIHSQFNMKNILSFESDALKNYKRGLTLPPVRFKYE